MTIEKQTCENCGKPIDIVEFGMGNDIAWCCEKCAKVGGYRYAKLKMNPAEIALFGCIDKILVEIK